MRHACRTLLLIGALTNAVLLAQSQASRTASSNDVTIAFTYAAEESNAVSGGTFHGQGGSLELSASFYNGFGVALNVAGSQATNIGNTGVNLSTITMTFGPHYTWHASNRMDLFGEGLVGESNGFNSVFPSAGGADSSTNCLATRTGGGVDVRLSQHLAIRPIQVSWVRTQFPNSTTNVQNNVRFEAGLVFRLSR